MSCEPAIALILPAQPASIAFMALALTAAIVIPVGFLFGLLREKMAATISKKTS
jgi:hypothetical protein